MCKEFVSFFHSYAYKYHAGKLGVGTNLILNKFVVAYLEGYGKLVPTSASSIPPTHFTSACLLPHCENSVGCSIERVSRIASHFRLMPPVCSGDAS